MKNERVVLIDNDPKAQKSFYKALRETHDGHRLEGMAANEEELMCLLRDGIRPTALVINSDLEKGEYLAELMKRRSPNIIVEFYSSEKALPEVAGDLVKLHH
jgi:hypothetical protein